MKQLISYFILVLLVSKFMVLTGCANIVPPTGGPRDSIPPRLISVDPKDLSTHFKTNQIVFNFDEYVEIKDIRENLVVSPVPKADPIVDTKLRTITVRLKDTLEPNTTYSLNFGKAIRDINEGNILKNFTYVFSTGSYLDSLQLSGNVVLAETGKTDSTLIVMLHRNLQDSAVVKERPRYFTHLDSGGNFVFRNLAQGVYALYALKDEGGLKRYTSKSQLFAFADSPVVLHGYQAPVTLYAFADTAGSKPAKKITPLASSKSKTQDKDKRLILQTNLTNGLLDLLVNLEISFPAPLKTFDTSKIRFTDENYQDISQGHFLLDSTGKKITLVYKWTIGTKYHLIAEKEFAEDTLGRKLTKTDTLNFQTKKESDYGNLVIRFSNLDLSKNPVLQFIQKDDIRLSVTLHSLKYESKLFQPGEYELRILYDDNKNGVWDPGVFFKHRQPEKVQEIRTPSRKPLNVKADLDNEVDITL
jgi:Bacterial Ig-like domain